MIDVVVLRGFDVLGLIVFFSVLVCALDFSDLCWLSCLLTIVGMSCFVGLALLLFCCVTVIMVIAGLLWVGF